MKKLSMLLIGFSMSLQASTNDVYGKGQKFIKVTESADKRKVGFEICVTARPDICKRIGSKKFYLKSTLESLRNSERWDIAGAVAADVGIIAVAIFGGVIVGTVVGGGTWFTAASVYTVPGGIVVGTGAGVGISAMVDVLNPYEQYKQLETLEYDILNDKKVFLAYDTETFAKRLGTVLDNL